MEAPETREQQLRGRVDDKVNRIVIVEGYDPDALDATMLSSQGLSNYGASDVAAGSYDLTHVLIPEDAPAPAVQEE